MATVCVEEDLTVQAARILLTFRNRKLLRRPEWADFEQDPEVAEKETAAPEGAEKEPEAVFPLAWPKRRRSGGRRPGCGNGLSTLKKLGLVASAGSSGEERSPRLREEKPRAAAARQPASPAYDAAPSGSGPSTSGDRKARSPEKVPPMACGAAAEPAAKEPMKAACPKTPLEIDSTGSAAGSGASSSGDEAARSKRTSPGSACSGDEGCSSPDRRARLAEDKAISEPVKFAFDLNQLPDDEGFF